MGLFSTVQQSSSIPYGLVHLIYAVLCRLTVFTVTIKYSVHISNTVESLGYGNKTVGVVSLLSP